MPVYEIIQILDNISRCLCALHEAKDAEGSSRQIIHCDVRLAKSELTLFYYYYFRSAKRKEKKKSSAHDSAITPDEMLKKSQSDQMDVTF
jgi:hypothetical protein